MSNETKTIQEKKTKFIHLLQQLRHLPMTAEKFTQYNILLEMYADALAQPKEALEIVKSLADWSEKYPRSVVYPMSNKKMDDELIAIEERATKYITEQNQN